MHERANATGNGVLGLGWRPIAMAGLCSAVYLAYWVAARNRPDAFVELARELTGISSADFHKHLWRHGSAFLLLMLIPLCYARFVEGIRWRELGLGIRGARREILLCTAILLVLVPALWGASHLDGFRRMYPRVKATTDAPGLFFAFHAAYGVKWLAWEFFFRGFMLYGFKRHVGAAAVLVSTIPFVMAHLGKPLLEVVASFFFGLLLCWITLRGRSIWPGVGLHWGVSFFLELFAARFFRG